MTMDRRGPEDDDRGKWLGVGWAAWAIVAILLIAILGTAGAQDAPSEPIRCEAGWCLIREQQLVEISKTLAAMRDQLEQYAKLCKWGTR